MIEYKFYKWKPFDIESYKVKVEKPHEHLSMIFQGNETSTYIQEVLDNVNKVKSGELEDSSIEVQNGFTAYLFAPNTDPEFTNGGVEIFDSFGPEESLFTITLEELIKLLEDFIVFLKENGK